MNKVYRAGIIPTVIENDEIYMMFMLPTNKDFGGTSFQIAKGKQEANESIKETALREGMEELGLFRGNIKEIHELGIFLGRMTVYVAPVIDKTMFGDPDFFETASVRWMSLKEFKKEGRKLHYPIIKAADRWASDYYESENDE